MSTMTVKGFKPGDVVDYHAIVGGEITSRNHVIEGMMCKPNDFDVDVAWITGKRGCVSLKSLSMITDRIPTG